MVILTKVETLLGGPITLPITESIRKEIFDTLSEAYNDATTDEEISMVEAANPELFLFGLEAPKSLIERASGWNDEIKRDLIHALEKVCPNGISTDLSAIEMDTDATYELCCAARELDNHWYDFADHAVYIENEWAVPFWQTKIPDEVLDDIKAHPESYLIFNATPHL